MHAKVNIRHELTGFTDIATKNYSIWFVASSSLPSMNILKKHEGN